MKKSFKAIITDMDGVLIDSEHIGWLCWEETCKKLGYEIKQDLFLKSVGYGKKKFLKYLTELFGSEFPVEEAAKMRRDLGHERMEKEGMPRRPGVTEFLNFCVVNKIRLGLATSTYREEAERRLTAAKIPLSLFERSACGDEVEHTKPAPDLYLSVAAQMSLDPKNVLVIEDTPIGATSALSAGMSVVIIPDLLPNSPEISQKALLNLTSLEELISRLTIGKESEVIVD